MQNSLFSLTRKQLKDLCYTDTYNILKYQNKNREQVFINNPLYREGSIYMYLALDNNNIVGRCYYFPTRFKVGEETIISQSASALYVQDEFRHLAIGADIIAYSTFSEDYDQKIFAGISQMALPIYKKLKYCVFPLQRFIIRRNFSSCFRQKGLHGILLKTVARIAGLFNSIPMTIYGRKKILHRKYQVQKLDIVPAWVDGITLNDGHKYMEVHDHQWLQWNLCGSFCGGERNRQSFYGVFEHDNPVGFFMTKERIINESVGMIVGSIVEWGAKDECQLTESDIYELALPTFSKDVYIVDVATTDKKTVSRLKKLGFIYAGEEHILFKDNSKKYKDARDANLWRLRYGYADTIFS